MYKTWISGALVLLLAGLLILCACPALAEESGEAEWTILFYMCGSDLESKYSYATGNLEEISGVIYPQKTVMEIANYYGDSGFDALISNPGQVNVLIETGGCREWHTAKLGMDISANALQRWQYHFYLNDDKPDGFFLQETLPLQSMADPETLSDFIRWGAEKYPAKKYALVLWDHGGGSKNGIFIDELFGGDVMYLDELGEALKDGGVHLETVLFDACLMAGLETASAIGPYADWMVASEEVVAGRGTAVDAWLQQLVIAPKLNGEWLGRWICDTTMIKYAENEDEQAQQLMTWSVIDLSKVPRLVEMINLCYASIGRVYAQYPKLMSTFSKYLAHVEHFGTKEGGESMWDVAGILYAPEISMLVPADTYQEMLNTLRDAVVYNQHGPGRSAARGLSYCHAVDFDIPELDVYARNCPMPNYLAFLDAITPWSAPDWVYETAERLPEMSTMEEYRVTARKLILEDGTPALVFDENNYLGATSVHYSFSKREEETGDFISFGTMPAYYDASVGEHGAFQAYKPWKWPALEGQHISSYVVDLVQPGDTKYLGSIPIQIGDEKWYLRYGYFLETESYVVYGLWEGYETDSGLFNRNVKSLSQMTGQEYQVLHPVYAATSEEPTHYCTEEPQTIYRAMLLEDQLMPPGKYYIQYMVYDMFMRPMPLKRIELNWDGENFTLADDFVWEGEEELKVPEAYWK